MGDYRRLRVWQRAHDVACGVYRATQHLHQRDQFVLGDQLRRAAISVAANIVEGCGRNGDGELRRFLAIALGSANELRYLLELALDVDLIPGSTGEPLIAATDEVRRMLFALSCAAHRGRSAATMEKGAAEPRPVQTSDSR